MNEHILQCLGGYRLLKEKGIVLNPSFPSSHVLYQTTQSMAQNEVPGEDLHLDPGSPLYLNDSENFLSFVIQFLYQNLRMTLLPTSQGYY